MAGIAEEYTKYNITDPATFFGMRLALARAVVALDAKRKANEQITPAVVEKAMREAAESEPLLKNAGTGKLVSNYIGTLPKDGMVPFYNAVADKVKPETLQKVQDNKANIFELANVAEVYNKSALGNFGMESLTTHFLDKVQKDGSVTKGVAIVPTPLTNDEIENLAKKEEGFRIADKLFPPSVGEFLGKVNKEAETRFAEIGDKLKALREGTSQDPSADAKAVMEKFTGAAYTKGASFNAEQGKEFAAAVDSYIVNGRSGGNFDAAGITEFYRKAGAEVAPQQQAAGQAPQQQSSENSAPGSGGANAPAPVNDKAAAAARKETEKLRSEGVEGRKHEERQHLLPSDVPHNPNNLKHTGSLSVKGS